MPYIKQEKREVLDPVIDDLVDKLRELQSDDPQDNVQGNLNYFLSCVLDRVYNKNYQEVNNAVGMMICATLEYYRRLAVPYENQKIFENGDVYEHTVDNPDSK